ncbi:ABC transporter permease [Aliiroseovarius sp. KMU-50]|uniref:Transport permease protein n=1 Tax=Aliiroseovarius salicola TaxID=3009082 RepID=A0ABT4W2C0_9RHOB|nr:ABC transporter permease [Aliiroseovarius sp. KMU-50]MDA5094658.1 ABC transporter permease [Aliiroseovarius sp. KMU-50]
MITSFKAIVIRELLRFLHQRERFLAALVRPLVWLFIFGAGFRAALGLSIIPPYETYIRYETYIVPGLCAMIVLFNAMQSSLSMVYDREMGSMRLLLTAPVPRWWILLAKLVASAFVSVLQCIVFLAIAYAFDIRMPPGGYIAALPALLLIGLMLAAMGLFLSSMITRLQNFAGVMNFVIFPMFFLSTALYPLWRMQENAPHIASVVEWNPFTYAIELVRFALYQKLEFNALIWVCTCTIGFFLLSLWGYDPRKSMFMRKVRE